MSEVNVICSYCGWPREAHAFKSEVDPQKAEEKLAAIISADVKIDGRMTSLKRCPGFEPERVRNKAAIDDEEYPRRFIPPHLQPSILPPNTVVSSRSTWRKHIRGR